MFFQVVYNDRSFLREDFIFDVLETRHGLNRALLQLLEQIRLQVGPFLELFSRELLEHDVTIEQKKWERPTKRRFNGQ